MPLLIYNVGISLVIPGFLIAFMLVFLGLLYGTLTHYGYGPAPVFFWSGYVDLKSWWVKGLVTGLTMLLIYMVIGGLWLRLIGYF